MSATATGGATTVIVAWLLVPPVPPSVELTGPLVLFLAPVVVPVTSTWTVQLEFAASIPPLKLRLVSPEAGAGLNAPVPQVVLPFGVGATTNPDGRLSVNDIPVKAVALFGFVIVNVRVATPPVQMVEVLNDLLIVGAAAAFRVAVLLVVPVPPLVEETAPVVFGKLPAWVAVTLTPTVQLLL